MAVIFTFDLQISVLLLGVSILLLGSLLMLSISNKRKRTASYQMKAILQPYIRQEIRDFIIPDGIGGLLEIEQLILIDQGLLLIESYPMAGNLFGAEKIDQWTQIIDGRSYKFANPLRHIRTSRQALKVLAPNTPIFCRVVFIADSEFPKGKPTEVSVLNTLAKDIQDIQLEPKIATQAQHGWERIMRIARKDGQAVHRGVAIDG